MYITFRVYSAIQSDQISFNMYNEFTMYTHTKKNNKAHQMLNMNTYNNLLIFFHFKNKD